MTYIDEGNKKNVEQWIKYCCYLHEGEKRLIHVKER
jgi:hypothetical protein